jgi:hypothetical protein
MNSHTPNRPQSLSSLWLARAAAVVTVISLQILWVGVYVCALRCAKGGCAARVAGAASVPAGDCGHSGTAPDAPAQNSGAVPHGRHCPASNLHNGYAAASAVAAPQMRLVSANSLVAVLPGAAARVDSLAAGTFRRQEISPLFIVPVFSSIPLRI